MNQIDSQASSVSLSNVVGIAAIAAITLAVAVWLSSQGHQLTDATTRELAPDSAALPGFRPDAFHLPDDDLLGFVEIPSGLFPMGSDPNVDPRAYDNERWSASSDQGTLDLPAFYIGRYEVTVAQFRAFVEDAGFHVDDGVIESREIHPIANVSWPDALAYCRWLDATLREWPHTPPQLSRLLNDGWQVTLPSEAQWEKAARGTDGQIFPWGDEPRSDRANYRSSSTTPVGSFACPECPYGLSDMSGNVWELTRSPYRPYPYAPSLENLDLDADALWVMRGGSYGDPDQNIRAAIRGGADPGARRPFIGFRVVLTP